jgi:hypothetical protein
VVVEIISVTGVFRSGREVMRNKGKIFVADGARLFKCKSIKVNITIQLREIVHHNESLVLKLDTDQSTRSQNYCFANRGVLVENFLDHPVHTELILLVAWFGLVKHF